MFSIWPIIGDEGDKISKKKTTGEARAETVRNFVTLGADYEGHNNNSKKDPQMR